MATTTGSKPGPKKRRVSYRELCVCGTVRGYHEAGGGACLITLCTCQAFTPRKATK